MPIINFNRGRQESFGPLQHNFPPQPSSPIREPEQFFPHHGSIELQQIQVNPIEESAIGFPIDSSGMVHGVPIQQVQNNRQQYDQLRRSRRSRRDLKANGWNCIFDRNSKCSNQLTIN